MTSTSPDAGDDLLDRHLVLRQRARLVRADDRRRPERLDRRQPLHDRVAAAPSAARRARARPTGPPAAPPAPRRPPARRRPAAPSTRSEAVSDVGGEQDRGHDDDRDRDHGDPEHAPDPVDLALQRRRLLLGRAEQPGDVAHLGRHAGRRHDRAAPARA